MRQFDGKTALVTGAGSGIGRATALAFARDGARVVVSDVTDAGQETVTLIESGGGQARFIRADVSDPAQVEQMVVEAVAAFGRLDIAFNNAGISGSSAGGGGPTADYPLAAWNQVIAINLTGVWLCMKAEIPAMLANGGGAIVNNASILGLVGFANAGAYVASKHGVVGLTRTAALEYATAGIRVNAVCPGFIHTPMIAGIEADRDTSGAIAAKHAMNRLGDPDEIAGAVLWLASPAASFVTGQAIAVDGGYVAQ
jgi:NAD(P)-dependent dehydrogenase (short-subunit alcohol dehydrogenase family)